MASRAVQLNFGSIDYPQVGLITENLSTEVKFLKFKCAGAGQPVADKNKGLHEGYLADLTSRIRSKYGGCFPNALDEEIELKIQDAVNCAVSCFCPEVDEPIGSLELAAASNIVRIASHEGGGDVIVPKAEDDDSDGDDDDDDGGGGGEVHMIEYTFSGKILSLLADVLSGETELEEFLAMVPNLHASEANQGMLMGTMITELISRPQWQAASLQRKAPVISEYFANARGTFLAHYDYLNYNRFTPTTYRTLLAEDNHSAQFTLEVRALLTGIEFSSDIRADLLFQRLRTLFGSSVIILDSLLTLEWDIENEITLQNIILIEFKHTASRAGQNGAADPAETRKELQGILDYWLDTLRGNLADLQVLVEVLPAVFRDEGLRKYLQLMVSIWNGQLAFFEQQQKKKQLSN